jgi:hypothetical protein
MKRYGLFIVAMVALAACAAPLSSTPPASPVETPAVSPVETPAVSPVTTPIAPTESSSTAPTATDDRVAVFPNTIIVYQREGGFAGRSEKWTIYQTGRIVAGDGTEWQVPADQVAPLFKLIESPVFGELNEKYAPSGVCNDCFTHVLTVYGPGEPQSVTFIDGADIPETLQQVLTGLNTAIAR